MGVRILLDSSQSQFKCSSCESRKSEEKTPTGADMSKELTPSAGTERVRSSQSILSMLDRRALCPHVRYLTLSSHDRISNAKNMEYFGIIGPTGHDSVRNHTQMDPNTMKHEIFMSQKRFRRSSAANFLGNFS